MAFTLLLHALAATIWVGGMFFAYVCLRPVAASQLEPPQRLMLWVGVFERFFPWVWAAVVVILATGLWMIFGVFGGMARVGFHVHIMLGLGLVMMGIFMHVYFAPFRRLKRVVANSDWADGARQLGQIRRLVGVNTLLGLATIAVATAGRYLLLA